MKHLHSVPFFLLVYFLLYTHLTSAHPFIPNHLTDQTDSLWYKKAIIYSVDVEVFKDSDNDGTGDFKGLSSKLEYLERLGITTIWLAPFQPSPNKDDGYDVSDYYSIDPRLGTQADFKAFVEKATRHHMHVIMDLVVNHTSDQHPWFQEARRDPSSAYRSWYVWSEKKPSNMHTGMVFPGVQQSIWTYDTLAHAYYYHRFYDFQPDLNMQNPAVQNEVKKVIAHWIKQGVSGFRLDGVPFFIEVPSTKGDYFERQYSLLNDMCAYVKTLRKDAIVLGEANVPPRENKDYFGEQGEGMDMMFNFYVNQQVFYSLASGQIKDLEKALEETHTIPVNAQWGEFLRNHDEVDLGRLSKHKRKFVFETFGPDKNMQLYDRGIRRRLAPMLANRAHLELAYSLMLSLPGTPVLRYGDEIGMGDDLELKERMSVRTPMQWSSDINGGFSKADSCVRPVIDHGVYGYQIVQVENEQEDSTSLLVWTERMLRLRKQCPEIGTGDWEILASDSPHVLIMRYWKNEHSVIVIHNFSDAPQEIQFYIDTHTSSVRLTEIGDHAKIENGICSVTIHGYGYQWYRLK
ncbi:MAG: alpha-amylase family protein [Cytophagales bacterium]|nr:alpha-amylase family protein [Cytophaga sp.]